jgi:hypothetical protein
VPPAIIFSLVAQFDLYNQICHYKPVDLPRWQLRTEEETHMLRRSFAIVLTMLALTGCASQSAKETTADEIRVRAAQDQIAAAVKQQGRTVSSYDRGSFTAADRGTVQIERVGIPGVAYFQHRPNGTWAIGCVDTGTEQVVDFGEDGLMADNWNLAGLCRPGYRLATPAPSTTTG